MINNDPAPATDDAPAPITLQDFIEAKEVLHHQIVNLLLAFSVAHGQLVTEYKTSLVEGDDNFWYDGHFVFESLSDAPSKPPEQ
jgi:hypothetical protein